jgi:hypothetical protein
MRPLSRQGRKREKGRATLFEAVREGEEGSKGRVPLRAREEEGRECERET